MIGLLAALCWWPSWTPTYHQGERAWCAQPEQAAKQVGPLWCHAYAVPQVTRCR